MEKAGEFLQAAELALVHGWTNACAQECYYAMFWATIALLEWTGQRRTKWSHGDVKRYLGLVLIRQWHLCPSEWSRWLETAYNLRLKAAYGREPVSKSEVQTVLRYASEFVRKAQEVRR